MNKDEDVFLHSTFVDFGIGILPVASEQPVIHDNLDGHGIPWFALADRGCHCLDLSHPSQERERGKGIGGLSCIDSSCFHYWNVRSMAFGLR